MFSCTYTHTNTYVNLYVCTHIYANMHTLIIMSLVVYIYICVLGMPSKITRSGWLYFLSFGGQRPEIKQPSVLVSNEVSSSLGLQVAAFPLYSHMAWTQHTHMEREETLVSLFLVRTPVLSDWGLTLWPHLALVTSL